LNHFVEEKMGADPAYRAVIEKNGRPYLSLARSMSDDELLSKLRELGLEAGRERLLDTFPRYISAQAMAQEMVENAPSPVLGYQEDWVWIVLASLWERWRPELASMERVNDKMQAGYAPRKAGDPVKACTIWVETWHAILDIMERSGIDSLDAFDDHFGGVNSVFNWVQDFEMELHNAGLEDQRFFQERIALCETMIRRFPNGRLSLANFKSALAASHFQLGDRECGDRLFRRWLDEDPQNGPWVAWSDCYWIFAAEQNKDAARAERILKEALATPAVKDRMLILDRLATVYEETARPRDAELVREEIRRVDLNNAPTALKPARAPADAAARTAGQGLSRPPPWGPEDLPATTSRLRAGPLTGKPKVGRNESCPCGSGKKFKKCCGRGG
jgi:tetratricopeptide (TPR) repeat protein